MKVMQIATAGLALGAVLVLWHPRPLGAEEVARVLGVAIDRSELPAAVESPAAELGRLYDRVWLAVSRHYIEQHRLGATREEIAEIADYDREFERRDRAQRARKLAELERRLADRALQGAERAWLEDFRATLARLAQRDAGSDRAPPPDAERDSAQRGQWVELWKLYRALYEQYGGVVALTRAGPFPHGARAALFADYERQGLLRLSDGPLRERLLALLSAPPAITVAPDEVDFTPFWKRPIPPSYFPD